jgi:nucleoside-diphosphate-sugar epimerase
VKVLITGHRGFVGRHMWRTLLGHGHDLTGVDLTGDPAIDVRRFFAECDVHYDLVIHLAAIVGGRTTIEGEPLRVAVDFAIDADLFQWALRTRPGRIVYYSSSAAYPIAYQTAFSHHRLREDDLTLDGLIGAPDMTYGWSKLLGEMLAQQAEAEGLRVHVFRPFSGYGTDQDPAYPFRAFLDRARRRADPFDVWGPGTQVRDWIHIDDLVMATLTAVDQDIRGPVNLCTGIGTDFLRLAELVTATAGYAPEIRTLPDQPAGVQYRVGDPTLMSSFYQPKITLDEGIQRALNPEE